MEFEARRFVRKVLLVHGGLLLLVLLIVGGAVKLVYGSARTQAISQAQRTQQLLAKQTALGIQSYYESVTGVLNLLQPGEGDPSTQPARRPNGAGQLGGNLPRFERLRNDRNGFRDSNDDGPPPREPTTEPAPGGRRYEFRVDPNRTGAPLTASEREARRRALESGPMARMMTGFANGVWEGIRDKASMLFVVDPADQMSVVRVIGSTDETLKPQQLAADAHDWLMAIHARAAGAPRETLNAATTLPATLPATNQTNVIHAMSNNSHLVAVPLRGPGALVMIAVVPISSLERNVLSFVNRSTTTGINLLDEKGTFISSPQTAAVGHNVSELADPTLRMIADKYIRAHTGGSEVFDETRTIGDAHFPPGISTIQPADVLGQKWSVVVSSNFDDVDNIVKPIFRDSILWSGFLLVAMTVILVSTSSQLILGRVRLERIQRQVMSREIAEARKIQLNWLPTTPCANQAVDIAALNMPATHISGDFYNWFDLSDGRTVVVIGDVTGHGMAAAFLMATTQLLVRNTMSRVDQPGACLEDVNRQLCVQAFAGQFVTLSILVLDPAHRTMQLANAGHPAPLVGPAKDGSFSPMVIDPELVLGVDPSAEYPTRSFDLSNDCTIILYTDGVLDAVAPHGERYKLAGLTKSLVNSHRTAAATISTIKRAIDTFRVGRDFPDDLTLVAIRLDGAARLPAGASADKVSS